MSDTNDLAQDLADAEWMDYFASDEYVPDRSAEEIDEILGRVARRHRELAETVARLPKDIQGNPVPPGGFLYHPRSGRRYVACDFFTAERDTNFGESDEHPDNRDPRISEPEYMHIGQLYTSRAAAEAAMRGEGPKESSDGI